MTDHALQLADDEHNERLRALVDPREHALAQRVERYDVVAVGGGTAGLVAATGAAMIGASVAVVERAYLGGDCLVTGCVPSKALLHAGRVAHEVRNAGSLGIETGPVAVDFAAVMDRLRATRAVIAERDSVETLRGRGVDVISGTAKFTGPNTLDVDGRAIQFKRALIATGGRPKVPPIPGLEDAQPLTSESVFELRDSPDPLVVIGGGPIGCELAQAMVRLGVRVTLIQRGARLLPADDAEAAAIVANRLRSDGVEVRLGTQPLEVEPDGDGWTVHVGKDGSRDAVRAGRILVATGRRPNLDGLELDKAGVAFTDSGIVVDRRFRSTNRRIYAAGDVASPAKFTHAAWAQAEYVVLNALLPARLDVAARTVPHATYTDPEVARVGLSAREVEALGDGVDTFTVPLAHNDRAAVEGEREGFARVHVRKGSDRILAATVVARGAGETIAELSLAMTQRLRLRHLAKAIRPYPTRAELVRDLAYASETRRLTPVLRWLTRWSLKLMS